MATLFKDDQVVEDAWLQLDGEQPVPEGENVIVTLDYFQSNRDTLLARNNGRLGVSLEPLEDVSSIEADLGSIALVALSFPTFADGTSSSKARLLRDAFGFEGEIRATGDVRIDQVAQMKRCGFDAFQVTHQPTIDALIERKDVSVSHLYQPAWDNAKAAGSRAWTRRSA